MNKILFFQLPVPQLAYRKKTGNINLAPAYLKLSLMEYENLETFIIPEEIVSYASDKFLINYITSINPDVICVTLYCWNLLRSIYLVNELKKRLNVYCIAGGPEVSQDNYLLTNSPFDKLITGEGETQLKTTLNEYFLQHNYRLKSKSNFNFDDFCIYKSIPKSPYLFKDYFDKPLINEDIDECMFLETQRGCPYHCAFCNYKKSRDKVLVFNQEEILKAIKYAYHNPTLKQVFLLDPSLDTRPDLLELVNKIANFNDRLELYSEIRVDKINQELINSFNRAGFVEFEVGLQTTNHKALELINRKTNLDLFIDNCHRLLDKKISPKIDLIVGLPGDNLDGFKSTVDFIKENNLDENIQVFTLSILPGTDFRTKADMYSLSWQEKPPYYLISSPGFNREDIINSYNYASKVLDIDFNSLPIADLSFKNLTEIHSTNRQQNCPDAKISKVFYKNKIKTNIELLSNDLTMPYQLWFFKECHDLMFIKTILSQYISLNPYTPLEIVFNQINNPKIVDFVYDFLNTNKTSDYLDNDLSYLYAKEGKRSFLISCITDFQMPIFKKEMTRQYYLWSADKEHEVFKTSKEIPDPFALQRYNLIDGIIINGDYNTLDLINWQEEYIMLLNESTNNYMLSPEKIIFADEIAQKNWLRLNFSDEFYLKKEQTVYVFK